MNKNYAKKNRNRRMLCALLLLTLCGCAAEKQKEPQQGPEQEQPLTAERNTIIITGSDGIIGYVNEEFDESVYSFSDFDEMVKSEVEDFSARTGQGGVTVRQCELSEGRLLLSLGYQDKKDYETFNSMIFNYGETVDKVKSQYQLPDELIFVDAHDPGKTITLGELVAKGTYQAVVTEDDSNIRILGKEISYIGEGDTLVSSCEVDTAEDAQLHVILY